MGAVEVLSSTGWWVLHRADHWEPWWHLQCDWCREPRFFVPSCLLMSQQMPSPQQSFVQLFSVVAPLCSHKFLIELSILPRLFPFIDRCLIVVFMGGWKLVSPILLSCWHYSFPLSSQGFLSSFCLLNLGRVLHSDKLHLFFLFFSTFGWDHLSYYLWTFVSFD